MLYFPIRLICEQTAEKEIYFNGKKWTKTAYCEEREGYYPFFADADMQDENCIEIEY